jgi:hypothetical protein
MLGSLRNLYADFIVNRLVGVRFHRRPCGFLVDVASIIGCSLSMSLRKEEAEESISVDGSKDKGWFIEVSVACQSKGSTLFVIRDI